MTRLLTAAALVLAMTGAANAAKINTDSVSYQRAALSTVVAAHLIKCDTAPSPEILAVISEWTEGKDYSAKEFAAAAKSQSALFGAVGKASYCRLTEGLMERMQSVLEK